MYESAGSQHNEIHLCFQQDIAHKVGDFGFIFFFSFIIFIIYFYYLFFPGLFLK